MNSDEYVEALFGQANPVPDAAAFANAVLMRLDRIEQWSEIMAETELKVVEQQTRARNRRGWLVAASAAALVLIVGAGIFTVRNAGDPQTTASGDFDAVGVWDVTAAKVDSVDDTNPVTATFNADGTYVIVRSDFDGVEEVFDAGRYEITDGVITFTTTAADQGQCEIGQVATNSIAVVSADQWSITVITDECSERGAETAPHILQRQP